METTQNNETVVNLSIPETGVPEGAPHEETAEKKERKKKDLSGDFKTYATVNPFNNEVVVKRFRQPEVPIGVVFVKYREGTPEREKFAEFKDGSSAWTWTTQEKRFDSTIKTLASGKVKYLDKDNIVGQKVITPIDTPVEEAKPVKEKKTRAKKEKVIVETSSKGASEPTFQFYEAPDDEEEIATNVEEPEDMPLAKAASEQFSLRKEAIQHAKKIGLTKKQAEESVKKVDGFWTVVQS